MSPGKRFAAEAINVSVASETRDSIKAQVIREPEGNTRTSTEPRKGQSHRGKKSEHLSTSNSLFNHL